MNCIYEYYGKINSGEVIVGKWIKLWYERIIEGLEHCEFFFDEKKANLTIEFVSEYCRHHEGPLAPQKIVLELWQRAFLSIVFGIVDKKGLRQFREVVLIMGRKNGKTLLAAAIAAYMAYMDGEYGARVYMCAPKLQQAGLCYDAFYQMVEKEPILSDRAQKRRTDIYIKESNSSVAPLAFSAKRSDGLNISCGICDEIASWSGDAGLKYYEVLKSSQGSREEPLLLSISTAGYENDSIYDNLINRSTAVILRNTSETRLAPFLYMIDDISKWDSITELSKSNPNMGVSVTAEYLQEEIAIAKSSLSKKAEAICKYGCIKQNSSQAWLDSKTVEKACGEALSLEDFRNSYCVGGIDLSQTTDLTSCCAVIEKGGELYVFSQFFMPAERIADATAEDGVPYEIYRQKGWLTLSGENHVDYHDCYNWFTRLIEEYQIYPLQIGYDRYSAQYLIDDLKKYGFHCDDVYQGFNLTSVIQEFEGQIKDGIIHIGDNSLLKIHFLNSALKCDTESQKRRLVKLGNRTRIDGMAALLDAMCVRQKWYASIGEQLKNKE